MLQLPSQELKDSFAKLAEFRKQKTVIPKNEVTRRRLATISTPSTSTGDSRTTPRRKAPAPPPAGAANQPTQNTSAVAGPPVPPRRPSAVSLTDESSPVPPKRAPPRYVYECNPNFLLIWFTLDPVHALHLLLILT